VEDDSVEIHVLSTKYQEIENLFARLCIFFKESKLEPKDVIVMAPKITDYASYIQAVFGDKIPYQLADLPFSLSHPLAKGLFLIFDLEKKRWSAPAILELLGNPLFSKKMHFTEDDLIIIRSWVQKTGIRWGLDGKHRGELLKKAHCEITLSDPAATWMEGLSYLLEELAFPQNSERIQIFQAELLGDLIVLLQNLRKTVEELETTKTIDQWVVFLKNCVETFFFLEDEADGFFSHIERIKQAGRHFPRQAYRFPTIYTLLKNLLSSEAVILNKNNHQTVHFCSMLPMRAIPAKVICLIGMQHDAFPRKEELQTLDLLKQGDYFPSRIDFDRYLFLEAILSAREKLIISYIGRDPFDHTELPPSSLVAELLPSLSPKCIHHHIKYDLSKIPLQPLPSFSIQVPPSFNRPTGEVIVELDDFIRAFRSPLNHFLRSQDIYFYEDELIQHDEPFILSPLKKASLKNEALLHSPEEALKKGDREGIFPLGLLGDLAKRQLLEEMAAFAHLKVNKVSFLFEPLHLDPSLTIIFRGNIPNVFSNGLYIPEKCTFKQAAKIWPYFLLLNYQDPAKQEVVFGLSNDLKQAFFNDPRPFLITCVDFYLKAKQFPFYWALDWLEPILKKNVHKLMHSQVYDLPLKWQLKGRERIDYSALIETYHPIIKGLYGEMADAWF
jgi:exodeoxyribonuclease V gamma subunit